MWYYPFEVLKGVVPVFEWIAQAVGIVAMAFHIFSYQQKKAGGIIACQLFGALFFSVSYFMLGAYLGAILNIVGVARALLFLKRDKFHTDNIPWLVFFCTLYVGAYILNFTLFGQEPVFKNLVIECLPVIGMVSTNLAFRFDSAKVIRRFGLVSSCTWLIYNIIAVAIGAILCEVFSIASIFIAMARLDKKKATTKE